LKVLEKYEKYDVFKGKYIEKVLKIIESQ